VAHRQLRHQHARAAAGHERAAAARDQLLQERCGQRCAHARVDDRDRDAAHIHRPDRVVPDLRRQAPDLDPTQLRDGRLDDVLEEAQDHAPLDPLRPAARARPVGLEDRRAVRVELQDGRDLARIRHCAAINAAG